ncbi:hypothetical protein [uncultured Tyzzerella sp.]|uniref:hypothetical protein n=1 Tax=uncultured Tyzzerella sp. TaxID=2321398 RepID=UPI0029424848|nr:hypothetical protein [uncultured Tyzzerella sp.]
MKKINEISTKLYIKGQMVKERVVEKLKNNDGEFYIDKNVTIAIVVVLGLILFGLAKDKLPELFQKAIDKAGSVYDGV